jgi:hypothetical protein
LQDFSSSSSSYGSRSPSFLFFLQSFLFLVSAFQVFILSNLTSSFRTSSSYLRLPIFVFHSFSAGLLFLRLLSGFHFGIRFRTFFLYDKTTLIV